MQMRRKLLDQYKNTGIESAVLSATPHKRVALLYDGAIRHVRQGRLAAEQGNIERKSFHTGKAMDIVSGLRSVLDHEHGGELAAQLDALYEFVLRYLLEASRDNAVDKYDVVVEVLETLQDGWNNMPDHYRNLDDGALGAMRAGTGTAG